MPNQLYQKDDSGNDIKEIPLAKPRRSGPDPSQKTLVKLAEERNLFAQAEKRQKAKDVPVLSPGAERLLDALLYTVSLAIVHCTFDVLVQHQYGSEVEWPRVVVNTLRFWVGMFSSFIFYRKGWIENADVLVFCIVFWPLHGHESNPVLLPFLPLKYQHPLRQAIFFIMSCIAGCYLIYISNSFGYLAIMKQAPPVGLFWLWAVIELDLTWAVLSLSVAGGYLWKEGYTVY